MEVGMKIPQLVFIVALTIAFPHGVPELAQSPRAATQDLLSMPIDNLELEAANIHLLLSELSAQKRVPIGLEISPYDDLSQSKTIRLEIKHGTLADALKSIVEQNPVYTWKLKDNVVNVLPIEANRDPLLRDVLEVKLEKFTIPQGTSRFTLRKTLSTTPEIRALLTQHDVVPEIQTFMSRDFLPLGRQYRLQAFHVTVAALLNQVIRESQTKYWIMLRNGDRKQNFVLNL
jgi:hypothetical protein